MILEKQFMLPDASTLRIILSDLSNLISYLMVAGSGIEPLTSGL